MFAGGGLSDEFFAEFSGDGDEDGSDGVIEAFDGDPFDVTIAAEIAGEPADLAVAHEALRFP